MNASKSKSDSLAPDEAQELFRELQRDFPQNTPPDKEDDDASVEAAWDAEIDARVKEVEEGIVELVSGAEFRRSTDALFDELGLKRPNRLNGLEGQSGDSRRRPCEAQTLLLAQAYWRIEGNVLTVADKTFGDII